MKGCFGTAARDRVYWSGRGGPVDLIHLRNSLCARMRPTHGCGRRTRQRAGPDQSAGAGRARASRSLQGVDNERKLDKKTGERSVGDALVQAHACSHKNACKHGVVDRNASRIKSAILAHKEKNERTIKKTGKRDQRKKKRRKKEESANLTRQATATTTRTGNSRGRRRPGKSSQAIEACERTREREREVGGREDKKNLCHKVAFINNFFFFLFRAVSFQ